MTVNNGGQNGFGSCNSAAFPNNADDLHGGDDYVEPGTCAAGRGGARVGLLRKCYHHFSYHGLAFADICVFMNLTSNNYTLTNGDIPGGYSVTHTYAPDIACTQTPNCGDAILGGTANSQCPSDAHAPACWGSITAGAFASGSTIVPKKGGVQVLTP